MSIQTNTLLLFCLTLNSIGLAQPIRWSAQDGGNDHWYQLAPTRLVWDDARDYAKSVGGRLVTVNDQTEQDWLVATFGNPSSRWTGLRYDNRLQRWRWNSGEAFNFTTWAPGEPNGFGPFPWSENYAVIWDQFGGSWCDYPSPVYNPGGPGEFRTEFDSIIEWKPCVVGWISLQAMTGTGFADTAAVYDPIREEIVVVGGQSGGPGTDQARVYRDAIWEIFAAPSDDALNHTACSFDRTRGVSVFFGGLLNGSPSDRTLEWDGLSWSSRSGGPSPRYDAAMAFDELRGRIVLFGGSIGAGFDGETWEWNGTVWQQLSSTGPSPRAWYHAECETDRLAPGVRYAKEHDAGLVPRSRDFLVQAIAPASAHSTSAPRLERLHKPVVVEEIDKAVTVEIRGAGRRALAEFVARHKVVIVEEVNKVVVVEVNTAQQVRSPAKWRELPVCRWLTFDRGSGIC
ncbi:MAG: hypothetical protein HEQ23_10050 [Tepidisphaera sp.]